MSMTTPAWHGEVGDVLFVSRSWVAMVGLCGTCLVCFQDFARVGVQDAISAEKKITYLAKHESIIHNQL